MDERVLCVGDIVLTNYHGKDQRVQLIERIESRNSQSGYSFRVRTFGGRPMGGEYDAAWFWKPDSAKESHE